MMFRESLVGSALVNRPMQQAVHLRLEESLGNAQAMAALISPASRRSRKARACRRMTLTKRSKRTA